MANPSVTYTFVNGQTADATQVNQNFTDLVNSLTDGSKTLTPNNISGAIYPTSTGVGVGTSTPDCALAVANSSTAKMVVTDGNYPTEKSITLQYALSDNYGSIQVVHTGTGYHTLGLNSLGGNVAVRTATAGVALDVNGAIKASDRFYLPIYTVASLPTATTGCIVYVSNETGGAVPAFGDGTNWRRVTDRTVVS